MPSFDWKLFLLVCAGAWLLCLLITTVAFTWLYIVDEESRPDLEAIFPAIVECYQEYGPIIATGLMFLAPFFSIYLAILAYQKRLK